ncbi:hypothetical protein IMCC12053_2096 [Celeribacter marinus]|uniref:Uncharacterized protein n=1 Tax=Celeribacter marinus TaxID=1397108 RepID=A0A0P0A053_9RHOB|nr:hypothetical protein IMCC12053_2096 [Celeribacter marinus]
MSLPSVQFSTGSSIRGSNQGRAISPCLRCHGRGVNKEVARM